MMAVAEAIAPPRSNSRRVVRRVFRNPLALTGLAVLAIGVVLAVFANWLAPHDPTQTHLSNAFAPPGTAGYLLGTDDLGRDVLSRIMFGLRASLHVGLLAVAFSLVIGVPLGLIAGYFRTVDALISRFTDLVLAFPFLILAVGFAAIFGASLLNATLALGIGAVPGLIRIARGETLALREEDYIPAAIANGAGDATIIFKHILPNMTSTLIVQATVTIPTAIVGEAVLSFLGLGVQPPTPSWGTMLQDAQSYLSTAPRLAIFPGLAIVLAALAFNVLGDGLRDILDPRTTR